MTKIKNNSNYTINGKWWHISEDEALIYGIAIRTEYLAKYENKKPSSIFSTLKIDIPKINDSWDDCDFRIHHYFDESLIKPLSETDDFELQITKILTFAKDTNQFLQTITTNQFANWPYLFCAQLQILCEKLKISPYEILYMFGISFVGNKTDSWDNFQWKYQLQADSIVVSLHSKHHIYSN